MKEENIRNIVSGILFYAVGVTCAWGLTASHIMEFELVMLLGLIGLPLGAERIFFAESDFLFNRWIQKTKDESK